MEEKILNILEDNRIFSIEKSDQYENSFDLREMCDRHFVYTLSKDQLLQLIAELQELHDKG